MHRSISGEDEAVAMLTEVNVVVAVLFRQFPCRGVPGGRRRAMADVIYLVAGVAVFLVFAGYALLLRRA